MSDRRIPAYRHSPGAWQKGYRDHQNAVRLHEMGCTEEGYDELHAERDQISEALHRMSADELRAFVDGMRSSMGEYFE